MIYKTCQHCGKGFAAKQERRKYCGSVCGHAVQKFTPEQRIAAFWRKVDKAGAGGCWNWIGAKDRYGYGLLAISTAKRDVGTAHRFSWAIAHGDAGDLHVLHICDNPRCVNPAHLRLGTHLDNMRDMKAKGRAWNDGHPKLTPDQVIEIRRDFKRIDGRSNKWALSKRYGVTPKTIVNAATGISWRDEGERQP